MQREQEFISQNDQKNALKIMLILGVVGLIFSAFYYFTDRHHFIFSYITSFAFYLALSLGGLFFVVAHHLTKAGWSVVVRRVPEHLMKNLPLLALFFIPIVFGMHDLYHWTHTADVANDPILLGKAGYLNTPFFLLRAVGFFGIWYWVSKLFFNRSVEQDVSGEKSVTLANQRSSTYGALLFGLTLTFSTIDWLMSITPHWYSTMWGVYFFAISAVLSLSVILLFYYWLTAKGYLKSVVTVEHFHDLGKLLFGFNIFWAYIAFSQYMLTWYANVPEETEWYMLHAHGNWREFGIFLAVGHFVLPFFAYVSRHAKRNRRWSIGVAIWMVVMSCADLYWLIMPNISTHGVHFSLKDVAAFLGIGGIYFFVLIKRMGRFSLYPNRDPRIEESVRFINL